MQLRHILILTITFSVPCTGTAATPINAGKLGHMKAVLEMCSRTSPQEASTYLLHMKTLIGDASRTAVNKAMRTDEYQEAYQSIHSEFSSLSESGIADACSSYFSSEN